jgi:hypothetical protein
VQLKERFNTANKQLLTEMQVFTPLSLLSDVVVQEDDVRALCDFYQLNATHLIRELFEFRVVYGEVHHLIVVDDLQTKKGKKSGTCSDEEENDDGQESGYARWIQYSFIKPLRLLLQLSGFPNLTCMYKILVSLAVTSCTAERSMSRVRIIKNRLRSTMLDDWFSSLMVLASEKDILVSIPTSKIIDRFALCSKPLHKLLMDG